MKRDGNPGTPVHLIHIRLGKSEIKLDARAVKLIVLVSVVLIVLLLGEKIDAATLKELVRLML